MTRRFLGLGFGIAWAAMLALTPDAIQAEEPVAGTARPAEQLRREILAWRAVLETRDDARSGERAQAMADFAGLTDPRAVPIVSDLWAKDHKDSPQNSQHYVAGLMKIGDRAAFLKLVEISVEDSDPDVRRRAAAWIGAQENRDDAIPLYVRYLRSKTLFHNALDSLGYTQITKQAGGTPDPGLVAALIDNLITVTPVRKRVPRTIVEPLHRTGRGSYRYGGGTVWVWVTEYVQSENPVAKELLYEFSSEDYGYDQKTWRAEVLKPIRSNTRSPR